MTLLRVFFLISLTGSVLLSSGCTRIEEVEVGDIKNFELIRFTGSGIEFEMDVPVENPNRYRVRVTEADLDIFYDGINLGNIANPRNIAIPGRSSGVYSLTGTLYLESLTGGSSSLMSIFFQKSADIEIKGSLKMRAFLYSRTFYVSETIRIDF